MSELYNNRHFQQLDTLAIDIETAKNVTINMLINDAYNNGLTHKEVTEMLIDIGYLEVQD